MRRQLVCAVVATVAAIAMGSTETHARTIKLAFIDPLSGGMASITEAALNHFRFLIDKANATAALGEHRLQLDTYDNKLSTQDSVIQVQKAIDAGAEIVIQGNGSTVAAAISDFVNKHNERNPGKNVVYLNYAAIDPVLTNEKCSYWHFRFDAHSNMKMEALTNFMKDRPPIKKLYLINQDYSLGQSVRQTARTMLQSKRPDIEIVGDELHPLAKITDFSPYIAKIRASGADTVITANWGNDFALLLKAAADAGLKADWFTYYAGSAGGPTAVMRTGLDGRVFNIGEWHQNVPNAEMERFAAEFKAKYGHDWRYLNIRNVVEMLVRAINETKEPSATTIAERLHAMKHRSALGAEGLMRPADHQYMQDLYVYSFTRVSEATKYDEENTGWGWKTVAMIPVAQTMLPTTCKMERPN
ncbi:branched-chain amino acid ABC transporter substrate-binding protein [Bradyrhizobium sp. JYMT SZCCT0180]|uniref:branched-chain amino acid ABC transporter substrate-binding protein n=1 Tax=Bradyrhizobium sp. JYMT SZCCT0180 TaxID=2807666 RepID=UPI0020110207|nr:branched-chain amino acid ABC transporter substrate-binding protein [Bradyrhizobium sp. JYMT SZCCT0180]